MIRSRRRRRVFCRSNSAKGEKIVTFGCYFFSVVASVTHDVKKNDNDDDDDVVPQSRWRHTNTHAEKYIM